MAGRCETCSHVGATIFLLEIAAKAAQSTTCTDELNKWLGSTMESVPIKQVKDIDFSCVNARLKWLEALVEGMVDKPLDVYLVTPLLNFSFNEMYLNRISNDLSKHIRRSYKGVKGKLILLSKPPRLPCISVGVMADEEIIFCAQMLSLSIIPDGPRTHLPLMCIMLNKKVGLENRIKSFLEERFCCAINRCLLSDTLFQWIMGIAVNETLKRSINEGITITYAVYKTCIHYTLEPEELLALWDECTGCGSKGLDINWTSVEKFVLGVNEHFFNTFGLNNIEMEAERVNVEGISIARLDTLRMKVKDDGLLFVLLKFIEITRIKCSPYYSPINCG